MTKDRYVLEKVKMFVIDILNNDQMINPYVLDELIDQWEFDYDLEQVYGIFDFI